MRRACAGVLYVAVAALSTSHAAPARERGTPQPAVQEPERKDEPLPPVPPQQGPPAPKPVPPAPMLDYALPFGSGAYEAALARLAESYPDLLRAKSLGKSRGGRDVWLATAFDARAGDPGKMPAAVVLTDFAPLGDMGGDVGGDLGGESRGAEGSGSPAQHAMIAGPQATLYALANLLERARADENVRAKLGKCALYFLPAPDPDAAFAGTEGDAPLPRACRLDRNFPAGWDPFEEDRGGGGPYPLSEPESRTLAKFLIDRTNVSSVVMMRGPGRTATEVADPATESPPKSKGAPGGIEAYAREVVGADVVLCDPWTGAAQATPIGNSPEGFVAAAARVEALLGELPRLECGVPKVERLRADLWLVDVTLANAGKTPSSRGASAEGGAQGVAMKTDGARTVSCAISRGRGAAFDPVRGGPQSWTLEGLDGGETVAVRLVVQGEEGANVAVVFDSARAGRVRVATALR